MKEVKEKKVFAEGYCFKKIFFFFIIGCIIGAYYEEIGFILRHGYWEPRRGLMYGPFSPVYGISLAFAVIVFGKRTNMKWYTTYIYSALFGGLFEYVLSWVQQILFHSRSWNYDGYFLSIGGRTTVVFMAIWGLMGLIFLKLIYPYVSKLIEKIPYKIGEILYKILLVFMILDILISVGATLRQVERRKGHKPATIIGEVFDKVYPDSVIEKIYANSVYE